jgi:CubicO group peptidase (beta-lactamase class C family)
MDRRTFLGLAGLGVSGLMVRSEDAHAAPVAGDLFNRRIPTEAHETMKAMVSRGITAFAFTPSNGWAVTAADGGYAARGIPDECFTKLGELIKAGHRIKAIAFPPAGGNRWVIATNKTIVARNIDDACYQKILSLLGEGHEIRDIAFSPGNKGWVCVTDRAFFARNIDDECFQIACNLSQGGRRVSRVAFHPKGGWAVVAGDIVMSRRIDPECEEKLREFRGRGYFVHTLAFSPVNDGWSMSSRETFGTPPVDKIREVEQSLVVAGKRRDIWTRMRDLNVPGVTIALVENDTLSWACAYGFLEKNKPFAVKPTSRFQAASVSKPVGALGVMRLLQDRADLDLSTDMRTKIDWALGVRSCVSPTNVPTIDRVLSHRSGIIGRGTTSPANACSGFSDGGGGFGGYAPGSSIPSLLQVMNGQGNSPKVEISTNPGTVTAYSGMAFLLLQRLVEVATGESFSAYMKKNLFAPLGMNDSTFDVSIPSAWVSDHLVASGHVADGSVLQGKRFIYPESIAAGLYTTVEDMAKLIGFLNRAYRAASMIHPGGPGDPPPAGPLAPSTVKTYLSPTEDPAWGRGILIGNTGTSKFFYAHSGANRGFRSEFFGYPTLKCGFVILMNSDNDSLKTELRESVKAVYGWP